MTTAYVRTKVKKQPLPLDLEIMRKVVAQALNHNTDCPLKNNTSGTKTRLLYPGNFVPGNPDFFLFWWGGKGREGGAEKQLFLSLLFWHWWTINNPICTTVNCIKPNFKVTNISVLSWYCAWPANTVFSAHWSDKSCFIWFCGNWWTWSPYATPATYSVANCSIAHRTRCMGHKRNVMGIGTVARDSWFASRDSGARTLGNLVPQAALDFTFKWPILCDGKRKY